MTPAFALRRPVLALAIAFGATPFASADSILQTVTVSGARFAADPGFAPPGATVISADEIRRAGVADANEAIRKLGAVTGRQSLDGSPDFALDLRGFGANSVQNMVVMVDGVRMSDAELGNANLANIPIETIERIEIIRGGASVLYGEGATGGVIQIVTRRPGKDSRRASARAELGSFGYRDLRLSGAASWDGFALDAAVTGLRTDNYRRHNRFELDAFSGGAQWAFESGRIGLRIDSARQDSELPGSLKLEEFASDPRQASTPRDFGSLDSDRATAFAEYRLGAFDLAAELSHRSKTVRSVYVSDFGSGPFESKMRYDTDQDQFSPRVRHVSQWGAARNELVAGFDWMQWQRQTQADFSKADARQVSRALYLRDELRRDGTRVSAGMRRERFDKDYVDPLAFNPGAESTRQTHSAWELQGSHALSPMLSVYAKAGRSYRVANADENSYRDSTGVLDVQTSRDLELGATFGVPARELTVRAFRHRLRNEIFFDPTIGWGANTNLDPTRRQGVELAARLRFARSWTVSANAQHVDAEFTEGPNAGRDMVLVPENTATARLAWVPDDAQSFDVGVQWTDRQRYGSDFSNSCSTRMPSFTTVDARYARSIGRWEFALAALNLGDRKYFSQAFGCRAGIYPADGRQLKLSARVDF
ncbi:TonB-dependent receptor domain-containing protein [Pseudoduganella sp. GCM10020061]|uniref:TonB-dependent receptor domain-containing protein n=1 Tax=Pseudoduganella sp. GCM10020061 TaxID=3317345 RepID=UPI00362AF72B